jgi:hypothetical protein
MTPVPPYMPWVEFVANVSGGAPPVASVLLQESGFKLLQENGSAIDL